MQDNRAYVYISTWTRKTVGNGPSFQTVPVSYDYDQMKGTAMATHATVVYANLTCRYLEVKLFNKLLEIFSYEMVEFFLKNYCRFLNDVKYNWK